METFSTSLAFYAGIHRSPVNSPHKGQWHEALLFSVICTRINGWINNGEAGDTRRHRVHYDVTVMALPQSYAMTSMCVCMHLYECDYICASSISKTVASIHFKKIYFQNRQIEKYLMITRQSYTISRILLCKYLHSKQELSYLIFFMNTLHFAIPANKFAEVVNSLRPSDAYIRQ